MSPEIQLALGRLFRMMSRPSEPGDIEMYYRIRDIVVQEEPVDHRPNWVRDRLRGAQGD